MQNYSVKFKGFKFSAILLSFYFSAFSFFEAGFAIDSPVGSGRTPVSSGRSGLFRSPNPIDTSSNLVITGNVTGNRYFRGVVPYSSRSDFGAPLGSSSLDSFLRRSAGSDDFGRFTGKSRPYYSLSKTVTTTRPGYSGVIRPPTAQISSRKAREPALAIRPRQYQSVRDSTVSDIELRPMSFSSGELEKLISNENIYLQSKSKKLTDEHRQSQMDKLRRDLKQAKDHAEELKQSLIGRDDSFRQSATQKPSTDFPEQPQTHTPKEQMNRLDAQKLLMPFETEDKEPDIYEQMKQQADDFQDGFGKLPAVKKVESPRAGEKEPSEDDGEKAGADEPGKVELSIKARAILGTHKTFASFSEDKFNQHMRAAEKYLKEGKYYRAADAYTLASIYNRSDPLAYAGKSHALFAAGEYMSSALFLTRALEIFPEYARFKIDIEAMVGDRDTLESRIVDLEQWLEQSKAPELQFLLGYVYYQLGRLERAKEAIIAAYEKMPDSPSVAALKKAIVREFGM